MSVQESNTKFDEFKTKARDFLNTPAVRFSLTLTGCCIASYLGGRNTMKTVEKNTRDTAKGVSLTNEFLVAEANLREARAAEDRSIIGEMTEANEPFVFYPGLGVLDLNRVSGGKQKKAS